MFFLVLKPHALQGDMYFMNPGRFAPITCSPRVVFPRKVSRFAPLNRYYIIIDEVFFDNFLVIIYLLVVHTKKISIHSFWSTLKLSKISSETFLVKFTKKDPQEQ